MFSQERFLLICTFLILIVQSACGTDATPSPLSASLSELEGTVGLKQPGQQDYSPAGSDSILQENGQVQTGDDGRVRLDLSSGTIIRVAPSSLFTLVSNEQTDAGLATKLQLELGQIFVILNGGSLDVETPSGVASVRGSYMGVWVDPETLDVYVTCLEGDCGAGNEAGDVDFSDGEKTVLFHRDPDTGLYSPPGVEPMSEEDFQEWLDNNPEAKEIWDQAIGTMTAMAATEPPATEPPTEDEATPTPGSDSGLPPSGGGGGGGCVDIVGPVDGSELPHQGQITFAWSEWPGATHYVVTFHTQNGNEIRFETDEPNLTRYIETLPDPGSYTWDVKAVDEGGGEICKTEEITFEKPSSHPEDLVEPKEEEEEPDACDTDPEGQQCMCTIQQDPLCCEYYPEDPSCQYYYLPGIYYPALVAFPLEPFLQAYQ